MPPLELLLSILAFMWGAIWGSFLNVVIHRLPLGQSVLTPPSHCPQCKSNIRWYQNVPILSYLFLGGKCANCKINISVRYPLVELVAATLSLAVWHSVVFNPFIPSLQVAAVCFVLLFFFVMALVAITFNDLEHMIIPDVISIPAVAIGLVFNLVMGPYTRVTWIDSLIGIGAGGGVIAMFIVGYYLITKRAGMGWGDAKLMAMLGAFLGYKCLLFVLLAGALQGLAYAGCAYAALRKQEGGFGKAKIPFGPFLALAGLEWFFFSATIETWFFTLFRV